jgi:hypothetical protein
MLTARRHPAIGVVPPLVLTPPVTVAPVIATPLPHRKDNRLDPAFVLAALVF